MKKWQLGMTIGVIGDISTGFTCTPKSVSIIPEEKQVFEVSKIPALPARKKPKRIFNNKKHKKRR